MRHLRQPPHLCLLLVLGPLPLIPFFPATGTGRRHFAYFVKRNKLSSQFFQVSAITGSTKEEFSEEDDIAEELLRPARILQIRRLQAQTCSCCTVWDTYDIPGRGKVPLHNEDIFASNSRHKTACKTGLIGTSICLED